MMRDDNRGVPIEDLEEIEGNALAEKTLEIVDRLRPHANAILLALGQTSEEEVFTAEGKAQMQKRLVAAINAVLKQKEGFGGVSNVYFTNFIVQ